MNAQWLLLGAESLPAGDEWLGPEERRVLCRFAISKRRFEWRLGRFTAKQALASSFGIDRLDRIALLAAEDGAPEAFVDGRATGLSISISHRADAAACAWSQDYAVGCDLEAVEPRTTRFVEDFFTERERDAIRARPMLRDRLVALTWSAKESALKVIRVGLRRDTRSVEVEVRNPEGDGKGWHELRATLTPEALRLRGWWRQEGDLVLTVVRGSGSPQRKNIDND